MNWTFTTAILNDPSSCLVHEMKKAIRCKDHDLQLDIHKDREDMRFVRKVATAIGWSRLWDMAQDHGYKCTDGVRNLARVIYPEHTLKPCPLCWAACGTVTIKSCVAETFEYYPIWWSTYEQPVNSIRLKVSFFHFCQLSVQTFLTLILSIIISH